MNEKNIGFVRVQNSSRKRRRENPGNDRAAPRVLDGMTELYRHYDQWDRLLYVGVSLSSLQRLAEHREKCDWFNLIATIKIERYNTRAEALKAERIAVKTENPYFNRVHNTLWHLRQWEHPHQQYADAVLIKRKRAKVAAG